MAGNESRYDIGLFKLLHAKVNIDGLLSFLNVRVEDSLRNDNPKAMEILNRGASLAAKCMFLILHYDYYVGNKYRPKVDPSEDYFHIKDQFREVQLETMHSLLTVRIGMVKQAITILRRCFELSVYGSFYSTSSYANNDGTKINPFVYLVGAGLWSHRMGDKPLGLRQIQDIVEEIRTNDNLAKGQAEKEVLRNFTKYYILRLTTPYCEEHHKERKIRKELLLKIDVLVECYKCGKETHTVVIDRPLTTKLMIAILDARFRDYSNNYQINMNELYTRLSRFVHPNPESHQHRPEFELENLVQWLLLLTDTLRTITWLYAKSLQDLGYDEKTTTELLNERGYDLNRISLNELLVTICSKVGEQYNQKRSLRTGS